jgi:2-oxoglutarate ferredoxin oxidoreductase subunit beta
VGSPDHLADLIRAAVLHPGFALVDILQPCVSFNHVNTYRWYESRCRELPDEYDPRDWSSARETALRWGDEIPLGILYRNDRPPYEEVSGRP